MNYKQRMAMEDERADLEALLAVDARGPKFSTTEYAIVRWPEAYTLGRTHPRSREARAYLLSSPYVYGKGDSAWSVAVAAVRARRIMLGHLRQLVEDDRARLDSAGEAWVRATVTEVSSLLRLPVRFSEDAYTFPLTKAVRKRRAGDRMYAGEPARDMPYVDRAGPGELTVRRVLVRGQLSSARTILRLVERRSRSQTMVLRVRVEYLMIVDTSWYKGREVPEKVEARNVREALTLSDLDVPEDTQVTVTREPPPAHGADAGSR